MSRSGKTSLRFGDLTYLEIRERAAAGWTAIVPTGCTEQQGPHLPVDFDTWFAETLALAAADRAFTEYQIPALVLPALPFGPTPEHLNFGGGYVHLPYPLHEAVVEAILLSLASQGFKRILVWQGCGGHQVQSVIARFNEEYVGRARVFLPEPPYYEVWCRWGDPALPGGHADSFTTSIALYLRPEDVRSSRIPPPEELSIDWEDPNLDFARHSSTGVIGDATHASAARGAKLWESSIEAWVETLRRVARLPLAEEDL